jgi:tetratricopeptide (TPR) repeat protein
MQVILWWLRGADVQRYGAIVVVLWLAGCAAAFVPATSDPQEKLNWAGGLVHMGSRPLAAERLIQEAITIYKQRDDEVGLAGAYRVYASFFTSPAIEQWRKWYAKHRFLDKTATVDDRYAKSIEYFQKAAAIYTQHNRTDWLTYVNLNMGLTYEQMGDRDAACRAFERSEENYRATARFDPEIKVVTDYHEVLASHKKHAC